MAEIAKIGLPGAQQQSEWEDLRDEIRLLLKHPVTEFFLGMAIISSIFLLIAETDASAMRPGDDHMRHPPLVLHVLNWIMMVVYSVEIAARLYVLKLDFFREGWTLDLIVVLCDVSLAVFENFQKGLPRLAMLRCFRLVRLVRVLKILRKFPELEYLLKAFNCAMVSIFWGIVMVLIMLVMWSILAVQVLNPINLDVAEKGVYEGCDRCIRSYGSVWSSFVTLTQQLVAQDSWAEVTVPLIEEQWWTYFIFLIMLATVSLAILNLILAAIVDSGQQAREDAILKRSARLRAQEAVEQDKQAKHLVWLCTAMDDDERGRLTKDEILKGYDKNAEFRNALQRLGFERGDMEVVFEVLDRDHSGDVDYVELLELMQGTKGLDLHNMVVFSKFALMNIHRAQSSSQGALHSEMKALRENIVEVKSEITHVKHGMSQMRSSNEDVGKLGCVASPRSSAASDRWGLKKNHKQQPQHQQEEKTERDSQQRRSQNSQQKLLQDEKTDRHSQQRHSQNSQQKMQQEEKIDWDSQQRRSQNSQQKQHQQQQRCSQKDQEEVSPCARADDMASSGVRAEFAHIVRDISQQTQAHTKILENIDRTLSMSLAAAEATVLDSPFAGGDGVQEPPLTGPSLKIWRTAWGTGGDPESRTNVDDTSLELAKASEIGAKVSREACTSVIL